MARTYTVNYGGPYEQFTWDEDTLLGVAMMAKALLGDSFTEIIAIYDDENKPVNLAKKLTMRKVVLLDGEKAFSAEDHRGAPNWRTVLTKLGAQPTKRYTLVIDSSSKSFTKGHKYFVVQFDSLSFLDGLATVCSWFGETCPEYLRALHDQDKQIDSPCCN